jgi:hypothetical protein
MRFSRKFFADQVGMYEMCRKVLDEANIRYPDYCFDLDEELPLGKVFERIKPGITEVVVHTDLPGNDDNDWRIRQFSYIMSNIAVKALERNKIECIRYSDW